MKNYMISKIIFTQDFIVLVDIGCGHIYDVTKV